MTSPIQIVLDEHQRIRSMLGCFETQLGRIKRLEVPDYEILAGSIAYCREYLDRWHHPREDALLDLLKRRAPAAAETCTDLEDQHLGLAHTTGELVQIFEAVEHDVGYPRARLVEMGQMLLSGYRQHLDWEEANFFPVVTEFLQPEDWHEITTQFAAANDPLIGNPVDQRYWALFRAIDENQA